MKKIFLLNICAQRLNFENEKCNLYNHLKLLNGYAINMQRLVLNEN